MTILCTDCNRARTLDAFMRPSQDAAAGLQGPDSPRVATPGDEAPLHAAKRRGAQRGVIRCAHPLDKCTCTHDRLLFLNGAQIIDMPEPGPGRLWPDRNCEAYVQRGFARHRVREQWQAEEGSRLADEARSVRQRPNPAAPSERLESIEGLLADVEKNCHQGTASTAPKPQCLGLDCLPAASLANEIQSPGAISCHSREESVQFTRA